MILKLNREMIEKTIDDEGVETLTTKSVEYNLFADNGEIKGNVSISDYNVSFYMHGEQIDIAEWKTKIEELFNKENE